MELEVDFGGEPLMNFDVVKQIVEYARQKEKEFGKKFSLQLQQMVYCLMMKR